MSLEDLLKKAGNPISISSEWIQPFDGTDCLEIPPYVSSWSVSSRVYPRQARIKGIGRKVKIVKTTGKTLKETLENHIVKCKELRDEGM